MSRFCKWVAEHVAMLLFAAMFYLLVAMGLVRCCTLLEIKGNQPSLNSWDPVRRAAAAQEAGRTFGGKP